MFATLEISPLVNIEFKGFDIFSDALAFSISLLGNFVDIELKLVFSLHAYGIHKY